VVLTL